MSTRPVFERRPEKLDVTWTDVFQAFKDIRKDADDYAESSLEKLNKQIDRLKETAG
jgi:hypothetical protein